MKKRSSSPRYVVGIDEVGRGSLAGPVAVAAVLLPKKAGLRNRNLGPLRDSKKLNPRKRSEWLRYFTSRTDFSYAVARVYPRTIERVNIAHAANIAASRAFARLTARRGVAPRACRVFLDGGLFLHRPAAGVRARTVVRGDEKINAVKAASIVAKVSRDALMVRLSKKYPRYGFAIHKGYGTRMHLRAVRRYGACEAHRRTFLA